VADQITPDKAREIAVAANEHRRSVWRDYRVAIDAVEAHWRPLVNEAKLAAEKANDALFQAIPSRPREELLSMALL
jgi:hypothetical protein